MGDYLGGCGSPFNCSITLVVFQHAVELVEIIIYNRSTVQYSRIRSIYHDQVQISHLFGLSLLGVQCTYERGSVAILIVPALVLFPPSNCTRMIAHLEINSTHGKYSGKYSIY